MKNILYLLGISLIATALVDLSFPLRITTLSFTVAFAAFFFSGYLFYQRIIAHPIVNSILVLFFLFALITYGYVVSVKIADKWAAIIICSVVGYIAGFIVKRIRTKASVTNTTLEHSNLL